METMLAIFVLIAIGCFGILLIVAAFCYHKHCCKWWPNIDDEELMNHLPLRRESPNISTISRSIANWREVDRIPPKYDLTNAVDEEPPPSYEMVVHIKNES